ncbi:MAG: AzlC family ABC transporter permease, partial [SAR324 cluster bacterium]|nr:AzlC family ABC transporter permease [SAR324 cluster bacterium]
MMGTKSKSQLFLQGAVDSSPLILAAIPFGLIFGALAITTGLSAWATLGMSLFVFAGASQFIAVSLLASAAALPVILLTVFVVNLRHMLYAASLMPQVANLPQRLRLPMAFWLTDETFAVVSNKVARNEDTSGLHWYFLGSALAMYSVWATCTVIGIVMGQQIP